MDRKVHHIQSLIYGIIGIIIIPAYFFSTFKLSVFYESWNKGPKYQFSLIFSFSTFLTLFFISIALIINYSIISYNENEIEIRYCFGLIKRKYLSLDIISWKFVDHKFGKVIINLKQGKKIGVEKNAIHFQEFLDFMHTFHGTTKSTE